MLPMGSTSLHDEIERLRERLKRAPDDRVWGITPEGVTHFEERLDEAGVPREEYAAQAGGVAPFTFWGRIRRLLDDFAELRTENRRLSAENARLQSWVLSPRNSPLHPSNQVPFFRQPWWLRLWRRAGR